MMNDNKLPPGKKCGDCWRYSYCHWLFGCKKKAIECDWSPSKYDDKDRILFNQFVKKDDEELKKIRSWNVNSIEEYHKFMGYITYIWHWDYYYKYGDTYELVTGGWSGNEDIIGAMAENTMFWLMYWKESHRGGRHVFAPMSLCDDLLSQNSRCLLDM